MRYQEIPPEPPLSPFVECLWLLSDPGARAERRPVERIPPDGCMELIVHIGQPFRRWGDDGRSEAQPRGFVVGQMTRFLAVQPAGEVATLGVRFRPGGAYPFIAAPLHELTDRVVPLTDLWGSAGGDLEDELHSARPDAQRLRVAQEFLRRRLVRAPRGDTAVRAAVTRILARRGQLSVARISAEIGVGVRELERRFRAMVGLAPKALSRIVRFQGVFRALGDGAAAWVDIALSCGYADQAHLVREFKRLSGQPPAAFLDGEGRLWRHFMSPQRLAGFFGGHDDLPA